MSEDFIYVPTDTELIPLPKTDYCTIKLTEYIDLIRKEQKLELVEHLIKEKQYDAAFELLLKGE